MAQSRERLIILVLAGLLVVMILVVGLFRPAPDYHNEIAIADRALTGGRVLVSDLSNIQDMIKHDGDFKEALLKSGFTEEQIRRLVGEEFLYFQAGK